MVWRIAMLLIGLIFAAVAANDVYQIVHTGGVFSYSVGVLHAAFFTCLGLALIACAILASRDTVKYGVGEFITDVFTWRNLREVGAVVFVAITVAALLAFVARMH